MIGFAKGDMLPALKDIWIDCFGDEGSYADLLFNRLLHPENILVYTDGESKPMAMLCLERFSYSTPRDGGDWAQGAYVYGVATSPEYQGRGLSTALLAQTHKVLTEEGLALSCLVPASESLFEFYGKRGYETAFQVAKVQLTAEEIPAPTVPCVLAPASLDSLADVRDQIYGDRVGYVRWSQEYLAYITAECKAFGGDVLRIGCEGEMGYAVCYRAEDLVVIKELAVTEALVDEALAAIHARFGAQRYLLYLPADTVKNVGKVLPFAMVRWYDREKYDRLRTLKGKPAWIAHVLD